MKIVSQQECHEWLSAKFEKEFAWDAVKEDYPYGVTYHLPVDTGGKTALARFLSEGIDTTHPGLLWITAWGIFPSSENMSLFDGYRKSLGEHRSIHAAPAHLFGEPDLLHIECLIDMSLYFYWDASLFDARGLWIKMSHDEYVSLYATDAARLNEFQGRLSRLNLRRLTRNA